MGGGGSYPFSFSLFLSLSLISSSSFSPLYTLLHYLLFPHLAKYSPTLRGLSYFYWHVAVLSVCPAATRFLKKIMRHKIGWSSFLISFCVWYSSICPPFSINCKPLIGWLAQPEATRLDSNQTINQYCNTTKHELSVWCRRIVVSSIYLRFLLIPHKPVTQSPK